MEVTTEPPPEISECSPISLGTQARARWGADAAYVLSNKAAKLMKLCDAEGFK